MKQQVKEEYSDHSPGQRGNLRRRAVDPMDSLASRVANKLEEGDYKGAVRLGSGSDSIADHSPATLESLKQKHPDGHSDRCFGPVRDPDLFSVTITEEDVKRAITSFPNGSAGGPDGLRPQHLKDLIETSANEGSVVLLRALTSLVSLIIKGKTPIQRYSHSFLMPH